MDIQSLIDDYASWLRKEITFDKIGDFFEITIPYLDNANDYLQIYVKQIDNGLFLTDDGATIGKLIARGFRMTAQKKDHLQRTLNQFGVKLDGNCITVQSSMNQFAFKKHMMVQAMLRIDDMFTVSRAKETPLFIEDIQTFFDENDIYYSDSIQIVGKSGFAHNYDFLMQRSKKMPERLCRAVNHATRSSMAEILFSWNDTKPARKDGVQLVVIINDRNEITRGVEDGFMNYDAKIVPWSKRNEPTMLSILSA